MRYSFWTDRPRNVSRRDYERYQAFQFGAIATGGMAALSFVVAVLGLTLQTSQQLAELPALTVAEASDRRSGSSDAVKIEGFLVADTPLRMPDDPALEVVLGELTVTARGDRGSDETVREQLFAWNESARTVFLSDRSNRVAIGFDLNELPLEEDSSARGRVLHAGEARTSRPVEVEYGDRIFPLNRQQWEGVDSVFVDVTRRYLVHGETVTIVAAVEVSTPSNRLVDPLGDRLRVYRGTEAEILREGQQARVFAGFFAIAMAIASFLLGRVALLMYRDFVVISQQQ